MGRGFLFSADAGILALLAVLTVILASHAAGNVLENVSAHARMERLRLRAVHAVDMVYAKYPCTDDGLPFPGCVTQIPSASELGISPCRSNCIPGCSDTPPDNVDVFAVDFNVCVGPDPNTCVKRACTLEVWR